MAAYILDEDEAVVLKERGVHTETNSTVDLILTNKNLIQVNKGFFGGDKDSIKYPLESLKTLNGKANILTGKDRNGEKQVELYFADCVKYYRFEGILAESKWTKAISKAHKERLDAIKSADQTSPEKGSVLRAIAGTLESAKGKLISKTEPANKTCKCPKCGAELTGRKGSEVSCSYCDYIVMIK